MLITEVTLHGPMRLLAVGTVALMTGCIGFGEGPAISLEYTLENLADERREASLGPHCGTARIRDGHAEIERDAYKRLGSARPVLIVEPDAKPGPSGSSFDSLGNEGFPETFPARIDPRIDGTSSPITTLDYQAGHVIVDGQAVTLPYDWTRTKEGDWRAEFRLSQGPQTVETFERGSCL